VSFARSHFLAPGLLLALTARAAALHIQLDYSYDAANGNYFGTHDVARATLEKAAADVGDLITTPLGAVTQNSFSGAQNAATTIFNWSSSILNPSTGAPGPAQPFTRLADTIVVHVGFRPLQGEPLTAAKIDTATKTIGGTGSGSDRVTATGIAEGASNAMMARDSAPVMESVGGMIGSSITYHLHYGPLGGSVSFDSNNTAELDGYWHFDASSPVPADKHDFYSAALRGIMHTVGFGEGEAWTSLASGTNWAGQNAAAFYGNDGTGLITTDGQIAQGLGAPSLFDGAWQPAAMSPGLAAGERRYLTTLDAAFLQDVGYQIIPEPRGLWLVASGALLLFAARPRARFRLV
jgi:hypothetical protein